jgi:RNA polymerase-binding transcription factor DksA
VRSEISEIIKKLGEIEGIPEDQAAAVVEARDILYDYEGACDDVARLMAKYETPIEAVERPGFGYCCPTCGKWIRVPDSWCHWCGQKIKWSREAYDKYKKNRKRS